MPRYKVIVCAQSNTSSRFGPDDPRSFRRGDVVSVQPADYVPSQTVVKSPRLEVIEVDLPEARDLARGKYMGPEVDQEERIVTNRRWKVDLDGDRTKVVDKTVR